MCEMLIRILETYTNDATTTTTTPGLGPGVGGGSDKVGGMKGEEDKGSDKNIKGKGSDSSMKHKSSDVSIAALWAIVNLSCDERVSLILGSVGELGVRITTLLFVTTLS